MLLARRRFDTSHRTRALRGRTHVRGVRAAAPACGTPSHASRLALRAQNEVVAQLLRDELARCAARALAGGVGGKCAGRAEERAGVAQVVPDDDPVPVEGRRRPHPHARGGVTGACPAPDFGQPVSSRSSSPHGSFAISALVAHLAVPIACSRQRVVSCVALPADESLA